VGLFDRLRGRDDPPTDDDRDTGGGSDGGAEASVVEPVEEVGIRRLTADEEAGLEAVRAGYGEHGIDPSDLESIAAAYDRALDAHDDGGDSAAVVELLGTAVGDHLVAAGGYRWVVATDPFGTDLAVEPPRRGVPVVTRMLVAVRWMGRERGWVRGVVGHLVDVGRT
jgi:hypothetical protein